MRIIHSIIAAIAKVRELQLCAFQVVPKLREGVLAYYWHTTDGLHYNCYKLSLEPTDTNIYIGFHHAHPEHGAMRLIIPNIWAFIECDGAIVQATAGLGDGDIIYLGAEEHFRVAISLDAIVTPN